MTLADPRYHPDLDGDEWGVRDATTGAWVVLGRYTSTSVSRWPKREHAARIASMFCTGTDEDRRRWCRNGTG